MTTKRHLTVTYTRVLPKPVTAINWRRASGYPPDAAGSGLLPKMGEARIRTCTFIPRFTCSSSMYIYAGNLMPQVHGKGHLKYFWSPLLLATKSSLYSFNAFSRTTAVVPTRHIHEMHSSSKYMYMYVRVRVHYTCIGYWPPVDGQNTKQLNM